MSLRILIAAAIMMSGVFLLCAGCGNDPTGSLPPSGPVNPFPKQHAIDVPPSLLLIWSYADTASHSFDIYFGTSYPPPIKDSNLVDTLYDPGPLKVATKYYWKVVAHTGSGRSESSLVWHFTTAADFIFPLAIGNSWDYSKLFYNYNFRPDNLADSQAFSYEGTGTTVVQSLDTFPSSVELFRLYTVWSDGQTNQESSFYRRNTENGHYEYGYRNAGWIGPPKPAINDGIQLEFKGMLFASIDDLCSWYRHKARTVLTSPLDSIVYEDPPIRVLAYPLRVENQWVYRDRDNGDVWDMRREVIARENVKLPIGDFECFKIRWLWDIDNDGQWDTNIDGYDYVSPIGVVRREFIFYDVAILRAYQMDTLGFCDVTDEFDLLNYNIEHNPQ